MTYTSSLVEDVQEEGPLFDDDVKMGMPELMEMSDGDGDDSDDEGAVPSHKVVAIKQPAKRYQNSVST